MGSIAEFEREILLERQRVGIAKAKAEGKYKGRAPKARKQKLDIQRMSAEGMKPKLSRKLSAFRFPPFISIEHINQN